MRTEIEIRNARISKTELGMNDHGILSFWIYFDYGNAGQGFGGISLVGKGKSVHMQWLIDLLKTVGVDNWEDLIKKHVRVEADDTKIYKIGNILEDKWFSFDLKDYTQEEMFG